MADPLSIIAFSLAGLHGCVKALVLIGKATSYNANVKDAQFRTTLLLHSLSSWAIESGLTSEPAKLLVSYNDAKIVPEVLRQIEGLFSNINILKDRYGSEVRATEEPVEYTDDDESTLVPASEHRGWVDRVVRSAYRQRKEPWKRLRWVAVDDEKFSRLLDRAKTYIGELEKYLEQAKQEKMQKYMELILRESIIRADERTSGLLGEKSVDGYCKDSLVAAARFKQTRLAVGMTDDIVSRSATTAHLADGQPQAVVSKPHTASNCLNRISHLQLRLLTLSRSAQYQPIRTLAQYDGQTVLLEWKHVNDINIPVINQRVEQIAALLHSLGPALHSLQCRGFIKDHRHARYGFIFDLPEDPITPLRRTMSLDHSALINRSKGTEIKTLREVFELPSPSLNARLQIATMLVETLLNLHTAGWLHKELHSGSIVLIHRASSGDGRSLNVDNSTTHIAGYCSSRADNPGELSETLKNEGEANLYRHPFLLADARQAFRKTFDIFSVGCTLLEIGLWSPMREILESHRRSDVPRPLARHMSDPSVPPSNSLDTQLRQSTTPFDLMALRQQLLTTKPAAPTIARDGLGSLDLTAREEILNALQSAMGQRYTNIVDEFIAVGTSLVNRLDAEDEAVLALEMRARDVVQSIASAT